MSHIGLVCCKATKAARQKPGDFEKLKAEFQQCIGKVVKDYPIPLVLILNFDYTAILVPTSE